MTNERASLGPATPRGPYSVNAGSISSFTEELMILGRAQAAELKGGLAGYVLSHFGDRRILAGELRLLAEYSGWIPRGATVLDWGCGPSLPSLFLHRFRPDLELKGANFNNDIQTFQIMWDTAGLSVDDLRHPWLLPYEDNSLDVVISKGVLEHVAHEQFSMAEVYRVLRDGGTFIVTGLPATYSLVEWFNRVARRPHHPRLYTLGGVKRLLLSCGFHVVWSAFRCACPLATPWADPVFQVWERLPILRHLTQNIAVIGVKSQGGMGDPRYSAYNLPKLLADRQSGEAVLRHPPEQRAEPRS